ncbi:MAG: aminopeptidase P family protein [Treponema sp.]|jgi:Xaa-Pro aminopeptidase|nr:aminopeptidase P family protein [Treponema sp.]
MTRELLEKIQKAIRHENLDGWLFCNFRHRDRLADQILDRSDSLANSRLWVYAVPARGEPLAITHVIESGHLDGLPAGTRRCYANRAGLRECLVPLKEKRWGVHLSEQITAISYLDGGTAALFSGAGLILTSAESLIQRFKSLLDRAQIESHERAANGLYEIVESVWDFVCASYKSGAVIYEGDLRDRMEDGFVRRNLVRDHPPLAAAGKNSANPHYDFTGKGSMVQAGDVIQLDLWAKEVDGIYADISWAGYYGKNPPKEIEAAFACVLEARDRAFDFIAASFAEHRPVTGAEVDHEARRVLFNRGYGEAVKHRTGHGIDTNVHGSGVNIDETEFPDTRRILEGSCFSLEPGIYLTDYGFRTEIDVYIDGGKALVSGGAVPLTGSKITRLQRALLEL